MRKTHIGQTWGTVKTMYNTPPHFQGQHLRRWLYMPLSSLLRTIKINDGVECIGDYEKPAILDEYLVDHCWIVITVWTVYVKDSATLSLNFTRRVHCEDRSPHAVPDSWPRWSVTPFFDTEYLTNGYRYAIVTIECETAPKLSNGISFNDIEWPLTHVSRSR